MSRLRDRCNQRAARETVCRKSAAVEQWRGNLAKSFAVVRAMYEVTSLADPEHSP